MIFFAAFVMLDQFFDLRQQLNNERHLLQNRENPQQYTEQVHTGALTVKKQNTE